jgi:uncharacterized protein YprB with RNaseH-like and TPR domain
VKWSRKLRKKLGSLNHGAETSAESEASDPPDCASEDSPENAHPPLIPSPDVPPAAVPFDIADDITAATGGEEFEAAQGQAFRIEIPAADIEQQWAELDGRFGDAFAPSDAPTRRLLEEADTPGARPEDLIFFDLETTGFVNTPLFLIGTMEFAEGRLLIRQWFARHYGEEPAVISAFSDQLHDSAVLVSFNGKSFDLPYTQTRAVATRTDFQAEHPHLDLLHISRRAWKGRLPNCKLQTLETHVCKRSRSGDIPGGDIPEAYHEFVRSGRIDKIIQILNHNVLDLLTMAELMVRMPR